MGAFERNGKKIFKDQVMMMINTDSCEDCSHYCNLIEYCTLHNKKMLESNLCYDYEVDNDE